MKKIYFVAFLCFSSTFIYAQMKATTENGEKVILCEKGTWKYEAIEDISKKNIKSDLSDCSNYIETTEDKVSGKFITASKEILVISKNRGKKGLGISVFKSGKFIIYNIQAIGAGSCIDFKDKMNVLFRDGTRLELMNVGEFNCDGTYTQYFGGMYGRKKELEIFKTKEVDVMRIWTSDSYVEESFTSDQSKVLMSLTRCISK